MTHASLDVVLLPRSVAARKAIPARAGVVGCWLPRDAESDDRDARLGSPQRLSVWVQADTPEVRGDQVATWADRVNAAYKQMEMSAGHVEGRPVMDLLLHEVIVVGLFDPDDGRVHLTRGCEELLTGWLRGRCDTWPWVDHGLNLHDWLQLPPAPRVRISKADLTRELTTVGDRDQAAARLQQRRDERARKAKPPASAPARKERQMDDANEPRDNDGAATVHGPDRAADAAACAAARRWFNDTETSPAMWVRFARTGAIESVRLMRDALRHGAVPIPRDASELLRYIESNGEREAQPSWPALPSDDALFDTHALAYELDIKVLQLVSLMQRYEQLQPGEVDWNVEVIIERIDGIAAGSDDEEAAPGAYPVLTDADRMLLFRSGDCTDPPADLVERVAFVGVESYEGEDNIVYIPLDETTSITFTRI